MRDGGFKTVGLKAATAMMMAGTALCLPALSTAAYAQERGATATFKIPSQDLGEAVAEFGRQSRLQVTAGSGLLAGRKSASVSGRLAPAEALSRLLSGTGLTWRWIDRNTVALEAAPQSAGGAIQLGPVLVDGGGEAPHTGLGVSITSDIGATEGTGSYTLRATRTATRLALSPRETPQSVSVVTREKIEDYALVDLVDVLEQTPGVQVWAYDSERSNFTVRGFAVNNFQYDSVPTTTNVAYSAGNTLTNAAIYDRVEVLKGAAGLLTGAGQPGAIVNLVRKKPTATRQGSLTIGAGSWRNYRAEADLSGPITVDGSIRARAVAAYQDQHSFLGGHERKSLVLYGTVEADLTPDTLLTVGADYQDNDPRRSSWSGTRPIFDRAGNRISLPRSYNSGANWSRWEQSSRSAFASIEQRLSDRWTLKAQYNFQYNGYDAPLGSIQAGPFADGSSTVYGRKYVGRTKTHTFDLYASGSFSLFGRDHDLVLGAQASHAHWTGLSYDNVTYNPQTVDDFWNWNGENGEPDWGTPSSHQDTLTKQQAAYATARFSVTDRLKLMAGGRLSYYQFQDRQWDEQYKVSGNFVPYAAILYDLTRDITWYASYTSIFQPQSYKDEQGRLLDPVAGNSYETGLKGEFLDGRLNASAAYFQIRQDNFAEVVPDAYAPDGTEAYRAIQGVVVKGFEFEASGDVTPWLQIQGGFTRAVARKSGARVTTTAPKDQFKLYATYRADALVEGLKLGGGVRWQSSIYQNIMNYGLGQIEKYSQSGYAIVDLMARYSISEKASVGVNVSNLFDKYYRTNVGFYRTTSYGEPRNATVNLKLNF